MNSYLKVSYPNSFKAFKCLGGECEDTCCKIWDIEIDRDTFQQYTKVKNIKMKSRLDKCICKNEEVVSNDLDFGVIKLKENGKCPFLDDKNYCSIYTELGEEYLSNICTNYPRILNKVNNSYEISLDVSCPEAARLVLENKESFQIETSEKRFIKYIVNDEYNTNSKKYKNTPIKYLNEIRQTSMDIMRNRRLTLKERLQLLGIYIEAIEENTLNNSSSLAKYINEYTLNERPHIKQEDELNLMFQIIFFMNLVNSTQIKKKALSDELKKYTNELIDGFNIKDLGSLKANSSEYIKAYKECTEKVIESNSYIFENYLVNFMYSNLFPFSESDDPFEGYIMLIVRFSFIKFYLVGMYMYKGSITSEEIIKFIQIFARDIEHDKSFIPELLSYVLENGYDNMEFTRKLL